MKKSIGYSIVVLGLILAAFSANAQNLISMYKNPSPDKILELQERAYREGLLLDVSQDGSEAALSDGFHIQTATSGRQIQLDTNPAWSSGDDYAVGGLRWFDVDNDGDLDLASVHYEGGYPARPEQTRIWFNNGGMLETNASWVSSDEQWSTDLAVGDINQDGYQDLVVANGWSAGNVIYLNNGSGPSVSPSWTSVQGLFTTSLILGDISGSGYLDLAVVNQPVYPDPGQPNYLYLNSTGVPGTSAGWTSSDMASNMSCALGDYDEDGATVSSITFSGDGIRNVFTIPTLPVMRILDVRVDDSAVSSYTVHLRDGWICFWNPPPAGLDNIFVSLVTSTDLDLAVAVDHGNAKVYHDIGTTLETTASFTVSGTGDRREKGIFWVDIDGDDDLDLFVGGRDIPMLLYQNDTGVINPVSFWQSDDISPDCADIDWIDADGDGDYDLATANSTTSPVFRVYENIDGALETSPSWGLPWGGSMAQAVAWGDMNNDGMPDLAVAHAGAPIYVYLNLASPEPTPTVPPQCIHIGDVNDSGNLTPEDALLTFQIYLQIIPDPSYPEACAADCNSNQTVTPEDALCIFLNYVSGSCACSDPS